tara:strand:- start:99 stop:326 length:228 start_codon:yes stop_codon:yes gene_type:complete
MKKILILFVFVLLISGCEGITGKVVDEKIVDERVLECVRLCDDGAHVDGYLEKSCANILEFGGEETLNDYMNECS